MADAGDLKSPARKGVRVRTPPPALFPTEPYEDGSNEAIQSRRIWSEATTM
jgi:hypothetical protein